MIVEALETIKELIEGQVPELDGRVLVMHAEREKVQSLPVAVLDPRTVNVESYPARSREVGEYILWRYGDLEVELNIEVYAPKKAQAVDLGEKILLALLSQPTIERDPGFGALTTFQEPDSGEDIQIRIDPNSWTMEWGQAAADMYIWTISGRLWVPLVRAEQRPEMDVQGTVIVEQGG